MDPVSKLRALEIDFRHDPRWDDFVAHRPDALVYHHSAWLATLESEYRQKCRALACEDEAGQLRAILPLFYTKGLPIKFGRSASGNRLASLPRTPVAGPLATDHEAMAVVLRRAVELVRAEPGLRLEIKSRHDGLHCLVPELSCLPWSLTYILEFPEGTAGALWDDFTENLRMIRDCDGCEDCRRLPFGNAKKRHRLNWAVNKAIRMGLQLREAETESDVAEWYPLYLDAMRHHSFPPRSYRFFANLWSRLRPLGMMKLVLAELNEGSSRRIVAGSVLLRFGQTVFYAFTGCARADFHLHPHDIIQLESIRDSCRYGFRWYDFGEVTEDDESLAQFKGKWGTEPKRLYRYYYPPQADAHETTPSPLVSFARRSWRSLPLRLTAVLGERIHRYL